MTRWCIKHKSIVAIISLFIFVAGIYSYIALERQENPDVVSPGATVQVVYPGATPEDVEKFIVKPLEKKLGEVAEIDRLESYCLDSVGVVVVRLKDLSDADSREAWNTVREKVDDAKADFPDEAWEPEIDTQMTDTYGMIYTISGDNRTYDELKKIADDMEEGFRKEPGVAETKIIGCDDPEVHINLDVYKMKQYNVPIDTIVKVLMAANVNLPGGNMEVSGTKLPVKTTGEFKNVEQIKNAIVGMSPEGNVIYLKDVADIELGEKKREAYISSNGEKSLILAVKFTKNQNVVKVGERLKEFISKYEKTLPEGVNIRLIADQSKVVDDSINLFMSNLISAIALVVLVVLITMGKRSAVVVSSSIPITVAATFMYMKMTGIILHQVSVAALILCLGLLVANAIVANDNMYVYLSRDMALSREDAIVESIREVRVPILTSTLTTVASYMPLVMMQGVAGKYIKSAPILVSVSLMASYLVSLTTVPAIGYGILDGKEGEKKKAKKKGKLKQKLESISSFLMAKYEVMLDNSLAKPGKALIVSIVILALCGMLVPTLGIQFFPLVDRDQYVIDVTVMDGSTVENTKKAAEKIEEILKNEPSVSSYVCQVGDGLPKFYPSFFPNQIASNKAQFIVNGKVKDIEKIQNKLDSTIPGARMEVKQLEDAIPVGTPVQVRISGEDMGVLREVSNEVMDRLYSIKEGQNVQDDLGFETQKLVVNVNQDKANMVGVTTYDISKMVRMVVSGIEITKMRPDDSDDSIGVVLQIPEKDRNDKELLEGLYVTSQITGKNVPLSQIAEIKNEFVLNKIMRRDRERTVTTGLYPKHGHTSSEVLNIVKKKMEGYEPPAGYKIEFGGENEDRTEAFKSLIAPALIAIGLIYIIMVFQFSDLMQPFIIMGTIPLSFIGVILGLKITGFPIGFMALVGTVSLMGIVVNNGIVLLDYINVLVRGGMELLPAVKEACMTRLRPIMVGMVTTVIGLLPLGLSGGTLWAPLAYSVVFGLAVSSVLTMIVIPASYVAIYNRKKRREKFIKECSI